MLAKIIDWSGRNRFLVLLATLFILAAGVFAVLRTPIDALPELSRHRVVESQLRSLHDHVRQGRRHTLFD